jgi:hypothetical protein
MAPDPLPPSDPSYRKPKIECRASGLVSVFRRQGDEPTFGYEVARLAPDEIEALVVFLNARRAL